MRNLSLFFVAALATLANGCSHDGPTHGHSHTVPIVTRADLMRNAQASAAVTEPATDDPLTAGGRVFARTCTTCHQPSGAGLPNAFPPLAGSDFLLADKERSVGIVLEGLSGTITVNGKTYAAAMPSHAFLSDDEIAHVLTYVRNSWGNRGEPVTTSEVFARRTRTAPTTGNADPVRTVER